MQFWENLPSNMCMIIWLKWAQQAKDRCSFTPLTKGSGHASHSKLPHGDWCSGSSLGSTCWKNEKGQHQVQKGQRCWALSQSRSFNYGYDTSYKDNTWHLLYAGLTVKNEDSGIPFPLKIHWIRVCTGEPEFELCFSVTKSPGPLLPPIPVNWWEWVLKPEMFVPGTPRPWAVFQQPSPGFSVKGQKVFKRT